VVSRGELIEIGDGFRIPEIMARSGATLREVGATNRTHIDDYRAAINDRTRLLLRVHPSNFRMSGFTSRVDLRELTALGRERGLPVYEDLGLSLIHILSVVQRLKHQWLDAGPSSSQQGLLFGETRDGATEILDFQPATHGGIASMVEELAAERKRSLVGYYRTEKGEAFQPVSYTHLDVYKRQQSGRCGQRSPQLCRPDHRSSLLECQPGRRNLYR